MKPQTVDEYITGAPAPVRAMAAELRELILAAAPEAQEKLSYGMPYYGYKGRLIYWGAYADRVALYVMSAAREALKDKIEPYRTGKATLRFSLDKPLPKKLITDIVKVQLAANKKS